MIYPIVAYGDSVLKKVAEEINPENKDLELTKVLSDMFDTMYNANGVGLAAPQVGLSVRLFIIDSAPMYEDQDKGLRKVFINPTLVSESGEAWGYEEGCLSIPDVNDKVYRKPNIVLHYFDENWQEQEEEFTGLTARVIQHEYDHIQGILFTDHLSAMKKTLWRNRLNNISKGNVKAKYPMRFAK
jgi:peptide deformylase